MHLTQLPLGQPAFVDRVDWDHLTSGEAQRLREFGVSEGVSIETLHRAGLFGHGALACRIGRMTVAMRHNHARAIHVRTTDRRMDCADESEGLMGCPIPDAAARADMPGASAAAEAAQS